MHPEQTWLFDSILLTLVIIILQIAPIVIFHAPIVVRLVLVLDFPGTRRRLLLNLQLVVQIAGYLVVVVVLLVLVVVVLVLVVIKARMVVLQKTAAAAGCRRLVAIGH